MEHVKPPKTGWDHSAINLFPLLCRSHCERLMHRDPVIYAQQMALLWEPNQNINHKQVGKHSNTDTQFNLVQLYLCNWGFPGGTVVKNMPANAGDTGDMGLKPGSGRSPGGGNGNPLHFSCPENSMYREAWRGHNELYATEYACIFIVTKKFWTHNMCQTLGYQRISYSGFLQGHCLISAIFIWDLLLTWFPERCDFSYWLCYFCPSVLSPLIPNQPSHCLQSISDPFFPEH